MAITAATNFTGSYAFNYATADGDQFDREHVYAATYALDNHTHGSTLGLAVTRLGTVTSVTGLSAALPITVNSATALTVVQTGSNYAFQVDTSGGTATGLKVTAAAAGSRTAVAVISSGTNEGLSLDAKGSGTIRLGATSTGAVEFSRDAVPTSNAGAALGTATLGWNGFHLGTGTAINWANGEVTITETDGNTLTIAGVATRLDLAAGILELNNAVEWDTGVAVVATEYSVGRDADATNQLHLNVPTGASFEFSVNDAVEMTLSATALNLQNNSLTTTGGGSLTGTWTDLGSVTTVDINGGSMDGAIIGAASAAAGTFTALTGTSGSITGLTGLAIRSTGAAYDLTFATASVFTAGRTLTINPGDAARTITLSGNPTLADWFDQSVKTTANPTFGNLTITSFAANWTNASRTIADLGTVTTVDINGGTLDGVIIGGAATAAASVTTLGASGLITASAGISVPTGQNVTGAGTAQVTGFATVSATTLTGTLSTAAQPNVTSLGTLTSLTVSGATTITTTGTALPLQLTHGGSAQRETISLVNPDALGGGTGGSWLSAYAATSTEIGRLLFGGETATSANLDLYLRKAGAIWQTARFHAAGGFTIYAPDSGVGLTVSGGGAAITGASRVTGGTLDLGTAGSSLGVLEFNGNTSGTITVQSAAAAGTWTLTLPADDGDAGEQLQTNGSGVTTWEAAGSLRQFKHVLGALDPQVALTRILATPVSLFRYRQQEAGGPRLTTTGDHETVYAGVMADEAPWAMHHDGRIFSPVSAFGHASAAIQALWQRITVLEQRLALLGGAA